MVAVLLVLAGGLLGVIAGVVWQRRRKEPVPKNEESQRQEARRYFLLNETGNVLISTSLSPDGRLPDATLEMFSEANAHLAALFYAVSGTRDPVTGKPFSLYNYRILRRALDWDPVFIRVSTSEPSADGKDRRLTRVRALGPELKHLFAARGEQADDGQWLDARVNDSRSRLGIDESPVNVNKLRAVHTQLHAEAMRIATSVDTSVQESSGLLKAAPSASPEHMEVGFITLYCECLMGVSLVSVKLSHAHYDSYLSNEAQAMEEDTYLFVSPSQLKEVTNAVSSLPRMQL